MVSYEDVGAAVDWLSNAFGFRESGERFSDGDGRVTHAELSLDGATVMLGWPGPEYRSPAHHAEECEQAARWLATPFVVDGVQVEVDDVNAHEAKRGRRARRSSASSRTFPSAGSTRRPISRATAGCSSSSPRP